MLEMNFIGRHFLCKYLTNFELTSARCFLVETLLFMRLPSNLHLNKFQISADLIEKQGLKPIKSVIESLGGWPILEGKNWEESIWGYWQKILLKLEQEGFSSNQIFTASIESDLKNSSRRIIYVSRKNILAL